MRKIVIKEWPYTEQTKAMLLRVDNPVYDGNGNWHTDVIFRSISKEDKKVTLDWGLLPMLKTGQIFSAGTKLYDQTNKKIAVFTFDNVEFKFFVDQIMTEAGIVQRPAFRAKLGDTYYHVPAIELVRSFFARTRRLAYALLEANSILPLCQCQISTYPVKQVVVHLSPDCPSVLASEKSISALVWMATDSLAQKSWDSFFHYFKSCQGLNIFPKREEEIPVFPLAGEFSLTCGYRSYGKNIWLDEIIKVDCNNVDFDEIRVAKNVTGRRVGSKAKVGSIIKTDKIEITNLAQSASNRNLLVNMDLPNFTFKKQPKISIIKKSIGLGLGGYRCIEKVEASIAVTGKNDGFTVARTGIEFLNIDKDVTEMKKNEAKMICIPELKEVDVEKLGYNPNIISFLEVLQQLSQQKGIMRIVTKIYEIPGDSSFSWITEYVKRCCVVSMVTLSRSEIIYLIEVDRTLYGINEKWKVATLLINTESENYSKIVYDLVKSLSETGHWGGWLDNISAIIRYKRIKHSGDKNKWTLRILRALVQKNW